MISRKDEFARFFYANPTDYERLREKALKCRLEVRKFRNSGIGLQVRDSGNKPFLDVEDFVDNHYNALFNQAVQFFERVTFIQDPQVLIEDDTLQSFLRDRDLQKFVNNFDDFNRFLKFKDLKDKKFGDIMVLYLKEKYDFDLSKAQQIFLGYKE